MKKTLLAIALAAATTTAYADTTLSGHINQKFGDLEDFNSNEDFTVGNAGTSQSRFRIKSTKEVNGVTWGMYLEHGLVDSGVNRRHDNLFAKGSFGKVTLGQGSEAGDGAVENDYSGTYLTQGDLGSWELGIGPDSDSSFSTPDGGRTENLRYDTPKLGMFTAAVTLDNQDTVSVEANLKGSMWKAGVYAATKGDAAGDSDEVGGSVAVKFGGFNVAVGAAQVDEGVAGDNTDLDYTNIVVGYRAGPVAVSVDLKTNENDAGNVDKETVGLNFVYTVTKGVELYAGYRTVDNNATDTDADGILAGGRVKF
jgi:hypothetical protein